MTHWRKYAEPSETIRAWDLDDKDHTLTIERVEGGEVTTIEGGKPGKRRMPMVHFRGAKKPLGLNTTNARTIEALYGADVEAWAGKSVTLYPTTTTFGRETVACVRIRPRRPGNAAK